MKYWSQILISFLFLLTLSCEKEEELIITEECFINLESINETDWEMATNIFMLINQYRKSKGLTPINIDISYASAYAVEHAKYMIDVGDINHDNYFHRSKCLKQRGASKVGEITAFGYSTPEQVVNAWINSPAHNKTISGNFNYCGYGVLKNANDIYYFSLLYYLK